MLFNSLSFLIFFPVVCILYFVIPQKYRWAFLLVSSYAFYMGWNAAYALLLLASTSVTYIAARLIEKFRDSDRKKAFLILSVVINLGILFVFKYFKLFTNCLYYVLELLNIRYKTFEYNLLLPVGISFYIFQALGYSIDVYRGDVAVQKHFGKYALFVSFFPQLVAGPIERSVNLIPQFDEVHTFDSGRAVEGLRLMLWGYYKKIVVADSVCVAVNTVYNNITVYDGLPIIIATFLFTIQIYCDFSGYSDIARGVARIMGFRLMKNFDHPYFSTSVQEFWRKWHISLSTWFKDYVYIPLGGNRKGEFRRCVNLLITFLVSGLWHGADMTFVFWGGLHGLLQIAGRLTMGIRGRICVLLKLNKHEKMHTAIQIAITFILVSFAWIFFRANSMSDAVYAVKHLVDIDSFSLSYIFTELKLVFNTRSELYRLIAILPLFIVFSFFDKYVGINNLFCKMNKYVRFAAYILISVYILLFARAEMQDFIYFQF